MKRIFIFWTMFVGTVCMPVLAQYTQTIRGTVVDNVTRMPLPGANVVLLNSAPLAGTTSDTEGNFKLAHVAAGRQSLLISFVGYTPVTLPDLIVSTGKELILTIELEETVIKAGEVVIKANAHKDQPVNKMASISARSFTIEETEKYAGSRGDVARMAMNFAGVAGANDQRNDIVIRGNSPSGLLWKLEGVEIPNPNHFANEGTSGGPVGMLNNNLLLNSDFLTGAFPAEYGNALSGVFDLTMRNGNNEKHEFLFQSGFNGFELGAEGPFSSTGKSSYLVNYRYSTMDLMDKIIDIGTSGIPRYQDFAWKINVPLKHGRISIFGIGGTSQIAMLDSKKNEQDLYSDEGQDLYNGSGMGATGLSYTHLFSDRLYSRFALSGLYENGWTRIDTLDIDFQPHRSITHDTKEYKISGSWMISYKKNSQFSQKAGISIDRLGFDLATERFDKEAGSIVKVLDFNRSITEGDDLIRVWYESAYRFNDKLTINSGIHLMALDMNRNMSLEPRLALVWQFRPSQKLSFGYGLHSKMQAYSTYYLGTRLNDGSLVETNQKLGFTRSNQWVTGYDRTFGNHLRLKTEAYYQGLFDVPVERFPSSFSMLNTGAGWGIGAVDSLINGGKGKNYGLEFTLEKFFFKNNYYLLTLSLFDSKYKGSDGIWRNTAFNGNYVVNALYGREFVIHNRSALTLDMKLSWGGGKRYTPIDNTASEASGSTEYQKDAAFSRQFPDYFKADIKFGYRLNGRRISQEWQFYVENFTNHKNVLMRSYSRSQNKVNTIYQLGVFPMILYRLHF